jgi:hypothetical protein
MKLTDSKQQNMRKKAISITGFSIKENKELSRYHNVGVKREMRYSSYSFLTSTLYGGEWLASRHLLVLAPVPIVQKAVWAPEPVWTQRLEENSFASAGD